MNGQNIRIRLKAFDHRILDASTREIVATAAKVLDVERYPHATYSAAKFEPDGSGGGMVSGTLTLRGQARPLQLQVNSTGEDRYRVTTSVVQSAYGIKPYTAFFGALKVRDAVDVEADIDLSGIAEPGPSADPQSTP